MRLGFERLAQHAPLFIYNIDQFICHAAIISKPQRFLELIGCLFWTLLASAIATQLAFNLSHGLDL